MYTFGVKMVKKLKNEGTLPFYLTKSVKIRTVKRVWEDKNWPKFFLPDLKRRFFTTFLKIFLHLFLTVYASFWIFFFFWEKSRTSAQGVMFEQRHHKIFWSPKKSAKFAWKYGPIKKISIQKSAEIWFGVKKW